MYSVIIQSAKTIESFKQFHPLFMGVLDSGQVGVCKWNESGTTVDTALPELNSLIEDKESWRAIIVRYEDDDPMSGFEHLKGNPYDFLVNENGADDVSENPVPLVRLTHMLGGFPPLERQFKQEIKREPHRAPKTVYIPIEDPARDEAYSRLQKRYRIEGKTPSSILIITLRVDDNPTDEDIGKNWISHRESDSSEFWKRNQYPSIARFIVFDSISQGKVYRDNDDFRFWTSVLLLSINEIDPSMLQAYRLYTFDVKFDKAAMEDAFQSIADTLRNDKEALDWRIKQDLENMIGEEETLPQYKINVSVPISLPKTDDRTVKCSSFHILSDGISSDFSIWNRQHKEAEDNLVKAVRSASRVLDRTANRMRDNCLFNEEDVDTLSKYQEEDLSRETDELYRRVVEIQASLPTEKIDSSEAITTAVDNVQKELMSRVVNRPAFTVFGITAAISVLMSITPIIMSFIDSKINYLVLAGIIVAELALSGLVGLIVLFVQKRKLNRCIDAYNQRIKDAYFQLVDNADDYSEYMSAIASLARGTSYLKYSTKRKNSFVSAHSANYKQLRMISSQVSKLKAWSRAFHLDVDFRKGDGRPSSAASDTIREISENKRYALEVGELYQAEVNNSGLFIDTPFSFVNSVTVAREELYDD